MQAKQMHAKPKNQFSAVFAMGSLFLFCAF